MLDSRPKIEHTAAKPIGLGVTLPPSPQARLHQNSSSLPAGPGPTSAAEAPTWQVSAPGLTSPGEGEAEEAWPRPPQEEEKKRRYSCPTDQGSNWLMGEPNGWIGRKVRNRANAAVYMVRQVFKNGRVQLERNWMSYMTDVQTLREKYEPQV